MSDSGQGEVHALSVEPGAHPPQQSGNPSAPKPDAAHGQLWDLRPLLAGVHPEKPSHSFLEVLRGRLCRMRPLSQKR